MIINPKGDLGSVFAKDFVQNLDIIRRMVDHLSYIDEGSFAQATFVCDHTQFLIRLIHSAMHLQYDSFPKKSERDLAIDIVRENDYA